MPRSAETPRASQQREEKPMRLFTHISFLATLLAILACAIMALVAIFVFDCPSTLLLTIIPAGCVCYFLSLLIAHFISRPLTELVRKVQSSKAGDTSITFAPSGVMREVDDLSESINDFNRI